MQVHDNLSLEAYYLAAKGYAEQGRPSLSFRPVDENISGGESFSDESWEAETRTPDDALVLEAAALGA